MFGITLVSVTPDRSVLSQSSSVNDPLELLAFDQPLERAMLNSVSCYFAVDLVKGEYVQIEGTSAELDIGLTLGWEDDENYSYWTVNALHGQSRLILSVIAPETRRYTLGVNALGKMPPGKYRLVASKLTNPPPDFFQRHQAQERHRAMLRYYYDKKETRPAFEEMVAAGETAAQLYSELAMPMMQADTLNLVGEGWRQIGSYQKAIEVLERAFTISSQINFTAKQAETSTFIGMCQYQLSNYQAAIEVLQRALTFWETLHSKGFFVLNMYGWTWQQLGNVYLALGETQAARHAYASSAEHYNAFHQISPNQAEWHTGMAFAQRGMGRIHALLGDKQAAIDALTDAIEHNQGAKDDYYRPLLLNDLGEIYASLGEREQANSLYQQALQLEKRMGSRATEAQTIYLIGQLHETAGAWEEAERHFAQSLQIRRDLNDQRGVAAALASLANLHAARGAQTQSLVLYAEAIAIQRTIGDRYNEAAALNGSGVSHLYLHEDAQAQRDLQQALAIRRTIGDRAGEAQTLYQLARLAAQTNQLDTAKQHIEASLKLTEFIRAGVLSQELRTYYLGTVGDYYEFYTDLLMRLHEREPQAGYQAAALHATESARARSLLEMLAEAQVDLRADAPPELLQRERELRQRLSTKAEFQMRLQTGVLAKGKHTAQQLADVAQELQTLNLQYQEVRARLRDASPRYAALTQPQPSSAADLQRLLAPNTTLLEYALGTERSFVWVVTRESVSSYVLPPRAQINAAAQQVYALLTARNVFKANETSAQRQARIEQADAEFPQAARRLSELVLKPVQAQLGQQRLLIVAQEALQFIPFAVLPESKTAQAMAAGKTQPQRAAQATPNLGYTPLLVNHEIVSLPSASTLAFLRHQATPRAGKRKEVAVLADPVFSPDDERLQRFATTPQSNKQTNTAPQEFAGLTLQRTLRDLSGDDTANLRVERLPGTRQEAERIVALAAQPNELHALDFAANRALATSPVLSDYRIVHFATHALINTTHPALSGIVLSLVDEQGQPQDGFLPAHEIFNLKFSADLVVLSACQTGLGKAVRGEGLVGMVQSFLYAGASSVAVSLWSQQDRSTAALMGRFYQHMLGRSAARHLPPAAALRAAQLEIMRSGRWPSPYFWAGFTVQGAYR